MAPDPAQHAESVADLGRFVYADPPYPGMGHFYEGGREVNHGLLIAYLDAEFDGWALSTGSKTLKYVLGLCPDDVRVAAWVKPWCSFKKGVNPAYAWEPIIFKPAARKHDVTQPTTRDWLAANATKQRGFVGAKPAELFRWVRWLMRMRPDEELLDLFPGSGAGDRALAQAAML